MNNDVLYLTAVLLTGEFLQSVKDLIFAYSIFTVILISMALVGFTVSFWPSRDEESVE